MDYIDLIKTQQQLNYAITKVKIEDSYMEFAIQNEWPWRFRFLKNLKRAGNSLDWYIDKDTDGNYVYAVADFRKLLNLEENPESKKVVMLLRYKYQPQLGLLFEDIPRPVYLDEKKMIDASEVYNKISIDFPFKRAFVYEENKIIIVPTIEEILSLLK